VSTLLRTNLSNRPPLYERNRSEPGDPRRARNSEAQSVIDLTIVILSFDTQKLLLECLASVEREIGLTEPMRECEVIVVDNGSRDGSPEAVRDAFPWVDLIALDENRGYAQGNNMGLKRARGRVIALLNSDVVLLPGAIGCAVAALENYPAAGAAGIQLLHTDGRPQNSIHLAPSFVREITPSWFLETLSPKRFPSKRRLGREPIEVESVLGAAIFVKREILEKVGLLPEAYFFFLEETDWCWQMRRAGYRVLHVPGARAIHHSGASSKQKAPISTRIEFERSLDYFLRVNRGRRSANAVRAVRIAKGLVMIIPLSLLGLVSARQRARARRVARLLVWQASGRPASWGLSRTGRIPDGR
jgi:GT2 family glycosyltransferase